MAKKTNLERVLEKVEFTSKLKPGVRAKWVKALRSGKFKQGKGTLCSVNAKGTKATYCCLGVLCEIMGEKKYLPEQGSSGEVGFSKADNQSYPTEGARKRYGLAYKDQQVLANLNDGGRIEGTDVKKQSFAVIADIIEGKMESAKKKAA